MNKVIRKKLLKVNKIIKQYGFTDFEYKGLDDFLEEKEEMIITRGDRKKIDIVMLDCEDESVVFLPASGTMEIDSFTANRMPIQPYTVELTDKYIQISWPKDNLTLDISINYGVDHDNERISIKKGYNVILSRERKYPYTSLINFFGIHLGGESSLLCIPPLTSIFDSLSYV